MSVRSVSMRALKTALMLLSSTESFQTIKKDRNTTVIFHLCLSAVLTNEDEAAIDEGEEAEAEADGAIHEEHVAEVGGAPDEGDDAR